MAHVPSAVRSIHSGQAVTPISPLVFPSKTAYPSKVMRCEVVFGSPNMDCNGTGICKIIGTNMIRKVLLKKSCRHTFGQIAAAPNGIISLFFFPEFLCTQLYRLHFRTGILSMKEACPLPPEIVNGLNLSGLELLPGDYTVVECDGYFRVDVDCA